MKNPNTLSTWSVSWGIENAVPFGCVEAVIVCREYEESIAQLRKELDQKCADLEHIDKDRCNAEWYLGEERQRLKDANARFNFETSISALILRYAAAGWDYWPTTVYTTVHNDTTHHNAATAGTRLAKVKTRLKFFFYE